MGSKEVSLISATVSVVAILAFVAFATYLIKADIVDLEEIAADLGFYSKDETGLHPHATGAMANIANFSLADGANSCAKFIMGQEANITQSNLSFDDHASWYDEKNKTHRIFYNVIIRAPKTKSIIYSCDVSSKTNQITNHKKYPSKTIY